MPKIPFYGSPAEVAAYEAQLAEWRAAPLFIKKSKAFADAVNEREWSNSIFNDPNAWIYAKVAVESNAISVDDYTSVMVRRAFANDFKMKATDIKALSLDNKLLREYLARQFRFYNQEFRSYDEKEKEKLADDFIRYAKNNLPANQCFCFTAAQAEKPGTLFTAIDRVYGKTPFFPEMLATSSHNERIYTYVLPSFPLLNAFQDFWVQLKNTGRPDKSKLQNITLKVCEGKLDPNDIASLHSSSAHPVSISTPYSKLTNADSHECGEYGFFWHDASFHASRLIVHPGLRLDTYVAQKMLAFYQSKTSHDVDTPFTEKNDIAQFEVLRRLTITAIDLESRYSKTNNHFGSAFELIVEGRRSTTAHEEDMKIYNPILTRELLAYVITSFIKDRETLRADGVDVEKAFKKMLKLYNREDKKQGIIDSFSALTPVYTSSSISQDDRAWIRKQLMDLADEIPKSKKMQDMRSKAPMMQVLHNIQAFLKTNDLTVAVAASQVTASSSQVAASSSTAETEVLHDKSELQFQIFLNAYHQIYGSGMKSLLFHKQDNLNAMKSMADVIAYAKQNPQSRTASVLDMINVDYRSLAIAVNSSPSVDI